MTTLLEGGGLRGGAKSLVVGPFFAASLNHIEVKYILERLERGGGLSQYQTEIAVIISAVFLWLGHRHCSLNFASIHKNICN